MRSGVVESLIKPGGNLTGVRVGGAIAKRLQLPLAIAPGTTRLFLLHDPDDSASVQSLADLKQAADSLGIELVVSEVRTSAQLILALASVPEHVDAYFSLPSGFLAAHLPTVAEFAIEQKIPLTAHATVTIQQGGLMSYGSDVARMGRQASRLAAKILDGTAPADLPVETADFFLGINLKTAEAIGIEVPDELLQQADVIIR